MHWITDAKTVIILQLLWCFTKAQTQKRTPGLIYCIIKGIYCEKIREREFEGRLQAPVDTGVNWQVKHEVASGCEKRGTLERHVVMKMGERHWWRLRQEMMVESVASVARGWRLGSVVADAQELVVDRQWKQSGDEWSPTQGIYAAPDHNETQVRKSPILPPVSHAQPPQRKYTQRSPPNSTVHKHTHTKNNSTTTVTDPSNAELLCY